MNKKMLYRIVGLLLFSMGIWAISSLLPPSLLSAQDEAVDQSPAGLFGINKAPCAYNTFASVIAAASRGDTIFVTNGSYISFIGNIDKNLSFVPSKPLDNCTREDATATSSSVIVDGNGASFDNTGGLVKISNNAQITFRHMWLRDATATNGGIIAITGGADVTLDDVNLSRGIASANGGGVYIITDSGTNSSLKLINGSNIYDNEATLGDGGGVAVINGTVDIDNGAVGLSSLDTNVAGNHGGGIYASGSTVRLNNSLSRVLYNQAQNGSGGGIYAVDSTVNITNGEVRNNSAYVNGGGIAIENNSSTLSIVGGDVENNVTTNSSTNQGGGGIYAYSGVDVLLDNALIRNNDSNNLGGGLIVRSSGLLTIQNGTIIEDNTAPASGGGLYVVTGVDVIVDASTIQNNSSGHSGGGMYLLGGSADIRNGSLWMNNDADWGGAIRFGFVDDVAISDSQLSLNSALNDGGTIYASDVQMVMTDTIFTQSTAAINGGTIYLADADSTFHAYDFTISGSSTTGSSTNEGGGCIFIEDALEVVLDLVFIDSCDSSNLGGAFFIEGGPPVTITNASMLYNQASIGGAFYIVHSDLTLENSNLSNNTARTYHGGAIYAFGVPTDLIVRDTVLENNNAEIYGGAIYAAYGTTLLENVIVRENDALQGGGGIYATQGDMTITSDFTRCDPNVLSYETYCNEIRNNTAVDGGGIAVVADATPPVTYDTNFALEQGTILGNSATGKGSGLYIANYDVSVGLTNTLVVSNTGSEALYFDDGVGDFSIYQSTLAGNFDNPLYVITDTVTMSLYNSNIWQNIGGPYVRFGVAFSRSCNNSQSPLGGSQSMGATNTNPIFASNGRSDYALSIISPMIDVCNTGETADLDGMIRPSGVKYDKGAFELNCPLLTPGIGVAGNNAQLTWSYSGGAPDYHVHRSTDPYAGLSGTLVAFNVTSPWTDTSSGVGNTGTNHFYAVKPSDRCASSPAANNGIVGEFDFGLVPGN